MGLLCRLRAPIITPHPLENPHDPLTPGVYLVLARRTPGTACPAPAGTVRSSTLCPHWRSVMTYPNTQTIRAIESRDYDWALFDQVTGEIYDSEVFRHAEMAHDLVPAIPMPDRDVLH